MQTFEIVFISLVIILVLFVTGDLLYPHFFKSNGQLIPNMATDVPLEGHWMNSKTRRECNPQYDNDCKYRLTGSNDQVSCSIGKANF